MERILQQEEFSKDDLVRMLEAEGEDQRALFAAAQEVKEREVGKKVYFRGLVEFSNICGKDCYYCGIRLSNKEVKRYNLSDAVTFRIEKLLREIKKLSNNGLGITLSLGEQTPEVYRRWNEAGAHRYLLRIETSSRELYRKLHPPDARHDFERRRNCLYTMQ